MASKTPSPFSAATFKFLKQLRDHNSRDWFEANKDAYEGDVREPALAFIRQMEKPLGRISPRFTAVDKKVGGSLMRVHRDVRFSKDKRPYKTNVGIQFRHIAGKDVHAPGWYVHLEPGQCFLGAGIWHPDAEALRAIRASIDSGPKNWKRVSTGKIFREMWGPAGDSLKRPPRGYEDNHPAIDDLRRKDHIVVVKLTQAEVVGSGLAETVTQRFRLAAPYVGWLTKTIGLPF
jgi:uncharacterized protein (TIGR02453 family)